jgi:hypothetical protein
LPLIEGTDSIVMLLSNSTCISTLSSFVSIMLLFYFKLFFL